MLFEKFTEKAIKVVLISQEESRKLGYNFVSTDHIFLGLIGEGTGIAAKVLIKMGVALKEARAGVEQINGKGDGILSTEFPFTDAAKKVIELALVEVSNVRWAMEKILSETCPHTGST